MQDCVLLWRSFAGRFNFLQFTCRRHARYVTQVLGDCTFVCLRLSGRQSSTPWVTYLAWAGSLTAAFAIVCKTLGSLCALQVAGAPCLLLGRHKFAVGKACSSFESSRDVSHQNRFASSWESMLTFAVGTAHSASTHKILRWMLGFCLLLSA